MSFIYDVDQTRPLRPALVHDPDESLYYTFRYRAPNWSSLTEKKEKTSADDSGDIVAPLTVNGFYAECTSTGITGASEPTWPTVDGETVDDGTVEWTMHTDHFEIEPDDVITESTWEADDDVVMDNNGVTNFDTYVRVTAVPDASSFTLTNIVTITREIGFVETINRSITLRIKEK